MKNTKTISLDSYRERHTRHQASRLQALNDCLRATGPTHAQVVVNALAWAAVLARREQNWLRSGILGLVWLELGAECAARDIGVREQADAMHLATAALDATTWLAYRKPIAIWQQGPTHESVTPTILFALELVADRTGIEPSEQPVVGPPRPHADAVSKALDDSYGPKN